MLSVGPCIMRGHFHICFQTSETFHRLHALAGPRGENENEAFHHHSQDGDIPRLVHASLFARFRHVIRRRTPIRSTCVKKTALKGHPGVSCGIEGRCICWHALVGMVLSSPVTDCRRGAHVHPASACIRPHASSTASEAALRNWLLTCLRSFLTEPGLISRPT
jgi:hypothetical protein